MKSWWEGEKVGLLHDYRIIANISIVFVKKDKNRSYLHNDFQEKCVVEKVV